MQSSFKLGEKRGFRYLANRPVGQTVWTLRQRAAHGFAAARAQAV
jgi:hypothetical protein